MGVEEVEEKRAQGRGRGGVGGLSAISGVLLESPIKFQTKDK